MEDRHLLLLTRQNGNEHPRLGLVVAKRIITRAVERNRLKRKIRETIRLRCNEFSGIDIVVKVLKRPEDSKQLSQELLTLFNRLNQCRE